MFLHQHNNCTTWLSHKHTCKKHKLCKYFIHVHNLVLDTQKTTNRISVCFELKNKFYMTIFYESLDKLMRLHMLRLISNS